MTRGFRRTTAAAARTTVEVSTILTTAVRDCAHAVVGLGVEVAEIAGSARKASADQQHPHDE